MYYAVILPLKGEKTEPLCKPTVHNDLKSNNLLHTLKDYIEKLPIWT